MESRIELRLDMVPPGRWAVGVSGGADSVALLLLLREMPEIELHIAHLDHQTRGEASTGDARFVAELGAGFGIPCTISRREEIEPGMLNLPNNLSAKYRAIRLELFRRVVEAQKLSGVILAHHADDQAETILLRLLRGSGPAGLAGMKTRTTIGGVNILRPLLGVRGEELRQYLKDRGQPWRDDASNESDEYARNRVRQLLRSRPELHEPILSLGRGCAAYVESLRAAAPELADEFPAIALAELPRAIGREAARRWLTEHGLPFDELSVEAIDRLREMAGDAATAAHQTFAGGVRVVRRSGWIRRE